MHPIAEMIGAIGPFPRIRWWHIALIWVGFIAVICLAVVGLVSLL